MGRRNVTKSALENDVDILENQVVAQVGDPLGKNLHQLKYYQDDNCIETIGQLPPKFRNLVWIKRGSYVISTIDLNNGTKVTGTIEKVLFNQHIKQLKNNQLWPAQFDQDKDLEQDDESEDDEDSDDNLFVNNNRRHFEDGETSEEEEDEEDEE